MDESWFLCHACGCKWNDDLRALITVVHSQGLVVAVTLTDREDHRIQRVVWEA